MALRQAEGVLVVTLWRIVGVRASARMDKWIRATLRIALTRSILLLAGWLSRKETRRTAHARRRMTRSIASSKRWPARLPVGQQAGRLGSEEDREKQHVFPCHVDRENATLLGGMN